MTYLQSVLRANGDVLAAQGVWVPVPDGRWPGSRTGRPPSSSPAATWDDDSSAHGNPDRNHVAARVVRAYLRAGRR